MANALVIRNRGELEHALMDLVPKLQDVLPRQYRGEWLVRSTVFACMRNPKILECAPISIMESTFVAAQLGLDPSGTGGQGYLIPYRVKDVLTCTFQPGYRGLVDLAYRSGKVAIVEARVVHEKDEFDYEYGLSPALKHVPTKDEDPGIAIGVYAVATLLDGKKTFVYMTAREVAVIKARSRGASSSKSPWQAREPEVVEQMWAKTAVRRLYKLLPSSREMNLALEVENAAEAGEPLQVREVRDILEPEAPPTTKTERLKADLSDAPADDLPDSGRNHGDGIFG